MIKLFQFLADNGFILKTEYINDELVVTLIKNDFCSAFIIDANISENDFYWQYLEPARNALKKATQ